MTNPLDDIENRKAQNDAGMMLNRVFDGAISDGASPIQAFLVTAAYFLAVIKSGQKDEDEEGGETQSQD